MFVAPTHLKMVRLGLFFLFLMLTLKVQSTPTDTDSLVSAIKNAETDSDKVLAIGIVARHYAPFSNEQAEKYYLKAIYVCDSVLKKGSGDYFEKEKASLQSSLGVTYYITANYTKALKAEMAAIQTFEKYGIKEKLGRCYVVIGAIYKEQNQAKKALAFHEKALLLHKENNDSTGIALALNNLGVTYFELKQDQKAHHFYQSALHIYQSLNDKRGMSVELLNLGSICKQLGKTDSAIYYFQKSTDGRQQINDIQGLIYSHARLGETQLEIGLPEKALENGLKSLEYATLKQYPRGISDANELLAKVYELKGNYSLALNHSKAYHAAKDSMTDAESISRVAKKESELSYRQERLTDSLSAEAQKASFKNEIALKDAKAEKQALANYFLILAVAFAVILVYFVYSRYKKSNQQNHIIQEQKSKLEDSLTEITKRDEEKELLLKEIHHRVKNNLQVISSLLELQAKKVNDSESEVFKEGQSRVRAMALIHEELYQNNDLAEVDFKTYSAKLSRQIQSLFPGKEKVQIKIDGPNIQLDIDTAIPLGLILNELVTNAFKYGLDKNGILNITFFKDEKENYSIEVKDNGKGMPDDFEIKKSKSLGLRLVSRLSKQLYGKADYHNKNGSLFRVSFKNTQQRKQVA